MSSLGECRCLTLLSSTLSAVCPTVSQGVLSLLSVTKASVVGKICQEQEYIENNGGATPPCPKLRLNGPSVGG